MVEVGVVEVGVVEVGVVAAEEGAVVDVDELPELTAVIRLEIADDGGFLTVAVVGTKAMVMSWPLANFRSWGSPLVSVPLPDN